MKNNSYRSLILLFFVGLFLWACNDLKNLDPAKDLKLILNYKPADAFVEAMVKDAKTGALIMDKINVDIIGTASANIINFEGEAKSTYTKKGPGIYLGLRNVIPTEKSPLSFKVIVSADGYLTTSREVTLTAINNAPFEILMVRTTTPPAGAAIKQAIVNASSSTGVSADNIIEVVNGQNATVVEIDKGTIVEDSKGNVLSGALKTTVATFSGATKEASKAFPGSNTTVLAKGPNGESNLKATIVPISFAAVEMQTEGGSKVATFSTPVDISFEIDPKLINLKTQKVIKEGDKLPVLSYGEATGVWTYEKEGIVVKKGSEYYLTFSTTHLSWFSIVQSIYSINPNENANLSKIVNFTVGLTIEDAMHKPRNWDGLPMWEPIFAEIEVHMKPMTEGGEPFIYYFSWYFIGVDKDFWLPVIGLPSEALKIIIKSNIGGTQEQVFEIKNIDAIREGDIYRIFTKRGNLKQKTILVNVTCENDCPLQIKPYNVGIQYMYLRPIDPLADSWGFLGFVNYDDSDNKVKLISYLPDNTEMSFRMMLYPEDIITLSIGSTSSFEVPIVLKKDHSLCNCNK